MRNKLRQWFIGFLIKNLYRGVREKDLLSSDDKGSLYFKGKKLSREQQNKIVREATLIQNTTLYRLLMEEMQFLSERDIITSKNSSEELFGKAQLYVLRVIRQKLKNLSKL